MKHLIPILILFALILHLSASAAVPLKWTVETSRAQPATFEAYQGETLDFEATLQSYGKPLEAPVQYAFYWQTNGMGSAYWAKEVVVDSRSGRNEDDNSSLQLQLQTTTNVLFATWSPEMDVGAKAYNCFIGLSNSIYHAAFQLRLRPSPGAVPNELPLPQKVIDFSQVTVLNPPWSGGGGSDVDTNAVIDIANATIATNTTISTLTSDVSRLTSTKRDKAGPDALVVYDASFGPWKDAAGNEYALTWIPYHGGYWVRNFDPEYPPPAPGSMWSEAEGLSSNETSMVVGLLLPDYSVTNFLVSRAITPVPTNDRLARVSQIPSGADRARWDAKVSYYADSYLIGTLAESTGLFYTFNPGEGWNLNNQGNFSFRLQGPDSENSYFSFSMYGRSSLLRPDGSDVMTSNKTASAISASISTNNPAFVSAVQSISPPSLPSLRLYDAVRDCYWIGHMVNGVITWEVED